MVTSKVSRIIPCNDSGAYLHGGDSYVYYTGTYEFSGGKWKGKITSQEHTPTTRPLAERVAQRIKFSGTYNEDGAKVDATALVVRKRIRYKATLRFLAAA